MKVRLTKTDKMLKVISGRKKTAGVNKNGPVGRVVPSIALGASSRIRNW